MIMQVHDELVFEVAEDQVEDLVKEVKARMESAAELKVPLWMRGLGRIGMRRIERLTPKSEIHGEGKCSAEMKALLPSSSTLSS